MRTAWSPEEFDRCFAMAQKESRMAFGDDTMYIEQFLYSIRNTLRFRFWQMLMGMLYISENATARFREDHQKLIEESPCDAISRGASQKNGRGRRTGGKGSRICERRDH